MGTVSSKVRTRKAQPQAQAQAQPQPQAQPQAQPGKFAGMQGVCAICGKPIAPTNTSGIGGTCTKHAGKVAMYYQPLPPTANIAPTAQGAASAQAPAGATHVTLVQLCNLAQQLGRSRGLAVKLCGGDAGTKPPAATHYTVYTQGNRKYVAVAALAALQATITGQGK